METVQIISEHKRIPKNKPVKTGYKRVEAIVKDDRGRKFTRHLDVKK